MLLHSGLNGGPDLSEPGIFKLRCQDVQNTVLKVLNKLTFTRRSTKFNLRHIFIYKDGFGSVQLVLSFLTMYIYFMLYLINRVEILKGSTSLLHISGRLLVFSGEVLNHQPCLL